MTFISLPQNPSFKPLPFDRSLTIGDGIDHHMLHNLDWTLFRYELQGALHEISWKSAGHAMHSAGCLVQTRTALKSPGPVIGILAHADTIRYSTVIFGLIRAGYVPFPISPRMSAQVVAHLIKVTKAKALIRTVDQTTAKLAELAKQSDPELSDLKIIDMPTFEELYNAEITSPLLPSLTDTELDAPAIILHSSGSTGFPKAITLTMRILIELSMAPFYGEIDYSFETITVHGVPMFHVMGLSALLSTVRNLLLQVVQISYTMQIYTGVTLTVFAPTSPPIIPTSERVFEGAIFTGTTMMFCPPTFLEEWASDGKCLPALKKFRLVLYGGGPLAPSCGDTLVKQGVNISPGYGQTETGILSLYPKRPTPETWQYFRLSGRLDPVLIPYEGQENVFRLVVKKCATHTPAYTNMEIDGQPALDTRDLLAKHPEKPDLYIIHGRFDDQIAHSTGEKTNPVPIESILVKDPRISSAIMFGRGRFHAGVIVAPSPEHAFNPTDIIHLETYRNLIWNTVEQANMASPAYSRIFKEMILVAKPEKPFEYTAKGTPKRAAVLVAYTAEIDAAYDAAIASSQPHLAPPAKWDASGSIGFVHRAVSSVMTEPVGYDDDFFQHGCDSLQATWIRNTILQAMKTSGVNVRDIPSNIIYANPTIRKLAESICRSFDVAIDQVVTVLQKSDEMREFARKYSLDFPIHIGTAEANGQVILLTGTTGALGSYILAGLLNLQDIDKVYALNRPASSSLHDRQEAAFLERGLDAKILNSPKLVLLEADLTQDDLGLERNVLTQLKLTVTSIIHNAWRVDFNLLLSSMEPLLVGTRQLIDLALSSTHKLPPHFVFISSIAVLSNWSLVSAASEERIDDPALSIGGGYGESKWCAEQILSKASDSTALKPIIVRVGQLSGGINGNWNKNEWFPSLVRSSRFLKCIPNVQGNLAWVPIHKAADVIVEMQNSEHQYLHLVHPKPVPASTIFESLAALMVQPLVSYSEWLSELRNSATGPLSAENPAVKLLDFFETVSAHPTFATDSAQESSTTLRRMESLGKTDVAEWLKYWN
ncbi:hypothetical protein C8J56DRAFT_1032190 [Mycena floridula]|nr:hypothetical protein C8J56DRAFT_1032190 [Mycena floridula]